VEYDSDTRKKPETGKVVAIGKDVKEIKIVDPVLFSKILPER
jgi:hypothetical protein